MRAAGRVTATSVVALAVLAAQGSQVLHELIVPHEICPEHGELVEEGGGAQKRAPLAPRPDRAGVRASGAGEVHQHDRCLAATDDGDALTPRIGALPRALVLGAPPLPAPRVRARRPRFPLFRLAPKTSPPV